MLFEGIGAFGEGWKWICVSCDFGRFFDWASDFSDGIGYRNLEGE